MIIHFYRNATMKLEYGGKVFLVDPMFRRKGQVHKLGPTLYPEKPPVTDLPVDGKEIAEGIDAVLLTHLHPGHFDQDAADLIPKDLPFFVQNLNDKDLSRKYGMDKSQTIDMTLDTHLGDIQIIRTAGVHGTGKIMHVLNTMQNSSGIVLKKKGEKTVYITGDTIFCSGVEAALGSHPDVIIAYLGANQGEGMQLTMGTGDLDRLQGAAPWAQIVAVHMETFANQPLTRSEVRSYAETHNFADKLIIPKDGETITL